MMLESILERMRGKKICVTKEDIQQGVRRSRNACPIALAVQREYPGREVDVTGFVRLDSSRAYRIPDEARAFIACFDAYGAGAPFCFRMKEF